MNASRTIPFREGGTCKCLKLNVQDPPSLNDVHTNLSRRSASSGLEQCLKSHSYRIININLHLKTTICSMLRFIITTICMGILNVPIDVNASI